MYDFIIEQVEKSKFEGKNEKKLKKAGKIPHRKDGFMGGSEENASKSVFYGFWGYFLSKSANINKKSIICLQKIHKIY